MKRWLIARIRTASREDIWPILEAARKRHEALFPDHELCILTLDRNREKKTQLDEIIDALSSLKEKP